MAAVTPMNPKKDDVGSHCVPDAAMMLVRPLREKIILKYVLENLCVFTGNVSWELL